MSSLDTAALRALVGEAKLSLDGARLQLDEGQVTAEDLESDDMRSLWVAVEGRIRDRRAIDYATLSASLNPESREVLLSALSKPELGMLVDRLAAVREASVRRRAIDAMRKCAEAIRAGSPLADVSVMTQALPGILDGVRGRVRETTGDTMRLVDRAAEAWTNGRRMSVATGWSDFDATVRFFANLHAIGAQGGLGKSALVAGMVRNWTRAGIKTGVLAYEDDGLDLQQRILACDAGLSLAHLDGDVMPDERQFKAAEVAAVARQKLEKYLLVDDAGRGTLPEALKSIREMAARGAKVVVLDNLSCVRLDGAENDGRRLAIEDSLLELREAAKRNRIPVIVIGHLKRGQTDADETQRRPKLTDFAGSSAWDRYARSMCVLWRDNGAVKLTVVKQNKGSVGDEFTVYANSEAATVVDVQRYVEPPAGMVTRQYSRRREEA